MIIELNIKALVNEYNGNREKMIKDGHFIPWTAERIKAAFNYGNGTENDFKRYMAANKKYCVYMEV